MYHMQDDPVAEPLETIHLYVVREGQVRPSLQPVLIAIVALSLLIAVGVLTPYQQPEQRASLRVPAVLLPLTTFTTTVAVIPTGVETIPATAATGVIMIYNGSILAEQLPQGMILTGTDGVEVVTDAAVVVPGANPPAYGMATVSVHAVMAGSRGNLAALAFNQIYGTSLYLRNLHPLTGGHDAVTRRVRTAQDRATALTQARAMLGAKLVTRLLYRPCIEGIGGTTSLQVTWTCQFVTYTVPSLPQVQVLHAQVVGRAVLVTIAYVPRPHRLETK